MQKIVFIQQSRLQAIRLLILFLLLTFNPHFLYAAEIHTLPAGPDTEIEITVYKAKGDTVFLWLYSEAGPQKEEKEIAEQLAKKGIEVWRVDLFSAHFLPVASSSMDQIPDSDFSYLIQYAYQQTGKNVIPVTTGRGSNPVLRGVRLWQSQYPQSHAVPGVILMSPKFYLETPEPGIEGKLLPIVEQTNLAIFILQPDKSPWFWKLDKTIPALEKSGSDVFVKKIKNVRDRYYFRPDATSYEKEITTRLPATLKLAANQLKVLPYKKRAVVVEKDNTPRLTNSKKERSLKPFQGNPTPPALALKDLQNKVIDLNSLKGQVVLVNFWASWCPPCVHEMPSMQRLQNRFSAKGFIILGVNMAEDVKTVRDFLNTKVNVEFPILFDSDGAVLKNWGVFAFPTSYLIDKKGKIRYAIFGGVDWEQASIVEKVTHLLRE